MRYTDYSKLSWYFKLNEVPCDMMQFVSPKGRKDRIELSKKYNFDPNDEFNYIKLGGVGPYSDLRVFGYSSTISIAGCRFEVEKIDMEYLDLTMKNLDQTIVTKITSRSE